MTYIIKIHAQKVKKLLRTKENIKTLTKSIITFIRKSSEFPNMQQICVCIRIRIRITRKGQRTEFL